MRLFIAFDIPEPHKLSIEKVVQPLRLRWPQARWTRRDGWHVTLKFLGEVPSDRLQEVGALTKEAVVAMASSKVRLSGFGAFPSDRRARVVWVGLEEEGTGLAQLAARLEEGFAQAGWRQEGRELKLHVTVARLNPPAPVDLGSASADGLLTEPFPVEQVVVYRSHLSPKGATYEPVLTYEVPRA